MSETVIRRYSDFKLYPNRAQAEALDRQRRMHCALYNAALEERENQWRRECQARAGAWYEGRGAKRRVWRKSERRGLTLYDQQKSLTAIRAADPQYRALSVNSLALTLRRVDLAFQAFMRRARAGAGARSGYPRFKRGEDYPGFSLRSHSSGCNDGWDLRLRDDGRRHGTIRIKGAPGRIRLRGQLPQAACGLKGCDVIWREGRWWLSLCVEQPATRRPGRGRSHVEFDLIEAFARVTVRAGRRAPGPETIYRMVEGRIVPQSQGPAASSAAAAPDSWADHGLRTMTSTARAAAAAPDSWADHGPSTPWPRAVIAAAAPDSWADHGRQRQSGESRYAAAAPDSRADHGTPGRGGLPCGVAATPESRTDHGGGARRVPAAPAEPESRADHGPTIDGTAAVRAAAEPDSRADHGTLKLTVPAAAAAPESRTDQGKTEAVVGRVEALQRAMARCRRGSCRYRALRRLKARREARLARRRKDSLHRWSSGLVAASKTMEVVAPASIGAATASGHGAARDPGAAVALKAAFNRRLLDQAPAAALAMLEYKCLEAGVAFERTEGAEITLGNEIVAATKANRRLRRSIRKSEKRTRA